MVESQFFESLPQCVIHKKKILQIDFVKEKFPLKKVTTEKSNGRADLPFPSATPVKHRLKHKWVCCFPTGLEQLQIDA